MPFPIQTATNTKITVGNTSTSVLAANSSRKFVKMCNDSDEIIYISYGSTAAINEGILLPPYGQDEIGQSNLYVGDISAICASGGKNLTLTHA